MCPSCRRTFLASEVPPPSETDAEVEPPPAKKPKTDKREMTLAEMQLQLVKRKATNISSTVEEDDEEDEHTELMAVEDSDLYNFDADRSERSFKKGQIQRLDLQPDGEEGKPCGEFKVGRVVTVHSVNIFSHLVAYERAAKEVYRIYPKKGSIWALHGGKNADSGKPKYEFVVFLSGYSELYGASFGYLEKVEGFRTIFTRRNIGSHAIQTLQRGDMGTLSASDSGKESAQG
ncbi:hypothetical protein GUJ93_ZPchr0012g19514 [Zizania palustris]|uniref:DUF3444 domain-containing protein n=1 Tax=Zizania palustris TaxID=103762 RepID=A0A8J5WPX4_ZIZPA|nr:hypothetical protein GUJ93_ZPchr0012g19514 [Zizania palustris]